MVGGFMEKGDRAHEDAPEGNVIGPSVRRAGAGRGQAGGSPGQRRGDGTDTRRAGFVQREATRIVVMPQRDGMDRLWRLADDADEVLTILPSPRLDIDFIHRARTTQLDALHNGVRLRNLYHLDIVSHVPSLAFVRELVAAGAEARSAPRLPTWLAIVGRKVVVMPVDPSRPKGEVLFVHGGGHLRTALWAFGTAWQMSVPLLTDSGQPFLTPMERGVLTTLARGAKDECGARELGVSSRTYRRCVTDLCTRLGASSRFEAGVLAVRTGLISWMF
jgi:hypothetical protein